MGAKARRAGLVIIGRIYHPRRRSASLLPLRRGMAMLGARIFPVSSSSNATQTYPLLRHINPLALLLPGRFNIAGTLVYSNSHPAECGFMGNDISRRHLRHLAPVATIPRSRSPFPLDASRLILAALCRSRRLLHPAAGEYLQFPTFGRRKWSAPILLLDESVTWSQRTSRWLALVIRAQA